MIINTNNMRTRYIVNGLIASLMITFAFSGCDSYNEGVIENLDINREFSPIGLKARVRNQTAVELNWTVKDSEAAGHYIVEFSADDPEFKTIFKTVEVSPSQLPLLVQLEGETVYSIRVKSVSSTGLADSKWSVTTATTLSEQIFFPVQDDDIDAKEIILKWTPNSAVTQISLAPGGIIHTITPAEKIAGQATVTGLTSETPYTATLLNGTKKRGVVTFTTGIDIGTGILVKPEDDLNAKIAAAPSNAILVLMPGDYQVFKGEITLDKPITIRGLRVGDKPLLHVKFNLTTSATTLSLIDLDVNGDKTAGELVKYADVSPGYGALLISGCNIHDFAKSLVSQSGTGITKITSVTVENSIVTNVLTVQGDFLDFRTSHLGSLTLKNSTFNNCAVGRDFIRIDNAPNLTGTGLTTNVLIDACTISNKRMTASNRILYVRFATNVLAVRNTLFSSTLAIYTNQSLSAIPTFSNNNYFNSAGLHTAAASAVKYDATTSYTTLDPKFVDSDNGDFTVKNQAVIDEEVGDPRWMK
jgi:hypothetical protein